LIKKFKIVFIFVALLIFGYYEVAAQHSQSESKLKAALLYKIPKYITWPNITFPNQTDTFNIVIFGETDIYSHVRANFAHPLHTYCFANVTQISRLSALPQNPHLVFVSDSEHDMLSKIIKLYTGKPVLIMSDHEESECSSAHINLYFNKDGYLHFSINRTSMNTSHLLPDIKLLSLAKIIY